MVYSALRNKPMNAHIGEAAAIMFLSLLIMPVTGMADANIPQTPYALMDRDGSTYASCNSHECDMYITLPKGEFIYKTRMFASSAHMLGYQVVYYIEMSADGKNWKRVAQSPTYMGNWMEDTFDPVYAKYIKIHGNGYYFIDQRNRAGASFELAEFEYDTAPECVTTYKFAALKEGNGTLSLSRLQKREGIVETVNIFVGVGNYTSTAPVDFTIPFNGANPANGWEGSAGNNISQPATEYPPGNPFSPSAGDEKTADASMLSVAALAALGGLGLTFYASNYFGERKGRIWDAIKGHGNQLYLSLRAILIALGINRKDKRIFSSFWTKGGTIFGFNWIKNGLKKQIRLDTFGFLKNDNKWRTPHLNIETFVDGKRVANIHKPDIKFDAGGWKGGFAKWINTETRIPHLKSASRGIGKMAIPVGAAMTTYNLNMAYRKDGNKIGDNTLETIATESGGWAGAIAGAAIVGAILTATGVGAPIGIPLIAAGAIIGYIGGDIGARKLWNKFGNKSSSSTTTRPAENTTKSASPKPVKSAQASNMKSKVKSAAKKAYKATAPKVSKAVKAVKTKKASMKSSAKKAVSSIKSRLAKGV